MPTLTLVMVLMVVVPAAGALLSGALKRDLSRSAALAAAAAVAVMGVWTALVVFNMPYREVVGHMPWIKGLKEAPLFGVFLDPLGCVMVLVITVIGFLTVLYSTDYMSEKNRDHAVHPEDQGRYYFWLLLFLASMVGVAISPNFLQLFVFWELTTLCSWALISFYQTDKSLRAGFKALLITHVGGLFFLVALFIMFLMTKSFDFTALGELPGRIRQWVFFMLMVAAWAKAGQVPFHTWLPDAMEAPTPISAYLHAAAMVKAGVYLMARSASSGWTMSHEMGLLLGGMALLTMFVALSFYFVQDDLKRLLAYSTIAHLGYILVGVALGVLGSNIGFRGGVLHIVCHGFGKATLFLCAGAVAYVTGTRSISALGGLGRTMPLTATAFFVGVLAVTGVPPFACFWSKFMMLAGAMQLHGAIGPVLLVLLLTESLISFGWMIYIGQKIFLGAPTPAAQVNSDPPAAMSATLIILMLGCLGAAWIGMPFVQWLGR
jgi:hydrogenase-4 component D